jgi:hypothetical protein
VLELGYYCSSDVGFAKSTSESFSDAIYEGSRMSTKDYVFVMNDCDVALYQEINFGADENQNDATIQISNASDFEISSETTRSDKVVSQLTVNIPASFFDEIALAWCKKRKLHR